MRAGYFVLDLAAAMIGLILMNSIAISVNHRCKGGKERGHECESMNEGKDHEHKGGCVGNKKHQEVKVSGMLLIEENGYSLRLDSGTMIFLLIRGKWVVGDRTMGWHDLPLDEGMRIEVIGHNCREMERELKVEEIELEDGTLLRHCKEG